MNEYIVFNFQSDNFMIIQAILLNTKIMSSIKCFWSIKQTSKQNKLMIKQYPQSTAAPRELVIHKAV